MIICHCHTVTDKEIRRNIKNGASSIEEISCACKACTSCQGCRKAIIEIIEEESDTGAK